ncbi:F-box domain-containing protein [Artemisia annua]|uniref:F-box domain-containing protein n=1 Tax=Artemisia annua TaxID=35608 RepID=A0A2U1NTS7_ARTAN|nr:F-box domain-containing protein [Artemisia annua]
MENIPDDVYLYIIIRLPAKLIARMRCVSKPWNDLLSQPCFIKSHLHHSVHNNKEILLEFDDGFYISNGRPCKARYSRPPNRQLSYFIKFPVDRTPFGKCFVIGSVNGLICFTNGESLCGSTPGVNICNPSLSALLHLPPCSIPSLCDDIYFRFGFIPKTDDYKVVKVVKFVELENTDGLQVEVYSLRIGSWKLITERFPSHMRIHYRDTMCRDGQDGHVHWFCFNDMTKQFTIVALDLHEETFCQIPLPDRIQENTRDIYRHTLGMWNDKLCVMSHLKNRKVEVWLMNEYKVAESWVNPYIFNEFIMCKTKYPFRLKVNNGSLFEAYRNSLAMYDPVAKSFKYMTRLTPPFTSRVVRYVDSLVWVAPSKSGSTLTTSANSKLKRKIDVISGE